MFSTSSQQPIEQTSAPISCEARVFSCRLAGAALFGFVYVSHLSLYQEIHADHSDAEAPRTNETVDLFMFDPLSLGQNNKLSNEVLPWMIYPQSLGTAEHPSQFQT